MAEPDLARWSQDGAMRALVWLACDLPHVDSERARRRLRRLTADQRALVEAAMRRALELSRPLSVGEWGRATGIPAQPPSFPDG